MFTYSFEAIGTHFRLSFWDSISEDQLQKIAHACEAFALDFDARYSRFKLDSLVTQLSKQTGTVEVPLELVTMLRLYEDLNIHTGGKINPAIGFALEDTGYDPLYSLVPRPTVRPVPELRTALRIEDATHITLYQPILLDLGALGKGFLIDRLYDLVHSAHIQRFLIDGSGDIRYFDNAKQSIGCGLEDPRDPSRAIGVFTLMQGSLCASAINRRAWGSYHHYLDPDTRTSPRDIVGTWVYAKDATIADGISSALFFVDPEELASYQFEYLMVNHEMRIKKSAGFTAEIFTTS